MPQLKSFDPSVLRTYDIRGLVDDTLTVDNAYTLGRLFGTKAKTVVVGFDGRPSSPIFADALCQGLKESGAAVTLVGLGPSPMTYFAERHLKVDGSIMVTGSHNPSAYNGFKMTLYAKPFWGDSIQELNAELQNLPAPVAGGSVATLDLRDAYIARLAQDFVAGKPLRVVWDCGNGAAGAVIERLLAKLPGEHKLMYGDVDGSFPNHHPDPTVDANMVDLQRAVVDGGYDVGIAFDGDGDRIGAVDASGTIIRGDVLMTIFARDVLSRNPGAPIIADVKCSSTLFREIERLGGQAVMEKTGHSPIKSKMAELHAPLAGELSGHIFFADGYYGFDDALYAAVRLLNALGREDFSALLGHLPVSFSTPELRIDVTEDSKWQMMRELVEGLSHHAKADPAMRVTTIDGVRLDTDHGWCLVRASNTQACLVARAEADSATGLSQLCDLLQNHLNSHGLKLAA